jgi:hypothetical protein
MLVHQRTAYKTYIRSDTKVVFSACGMEQIEPNDKIVAIDLSPFSFSDQLGRSGYNRYVFAFK